MKRLFPRLASTYALSFFCNYCKDRYASRTEENIKEVHLLIASLKIYSSWEANTTLQDCRECCGGMGYLCKNFICTLRADADAFVTIDGDNTVLLQQISRDLLGQRQQEVKDFASMLSFYGRQIGESVFNINKNFYTSFLFSSQLNSASFQQRMFKLREDRLLTTLANRFVSKLKAKIHPFDAWNQLLNHSNKLAMAHIHKIVLDSFVAAVDKCLEPSNKQVLDLLRSLYALSIIDSDPWFLTSEYIVPTQAKAIQKEVENLCVKIRPFAVDLVNAFGCPEKILEGTIASDWLAAFSKPK